MKYNVRIEGTFSGIKNIFTEQTYHLKIKCSHCNMVHDKYVVISEESVKYDSKGQITNFIKHCGECNREICIYIRKPSKSEKFLYQSDDLKNEVEEEMYLGVKDNHAFIVSTLECRGCFAEEVKGVPIHVLSEWGKVYRNVKLDDGFWIMNDAKGRASVIEEGEVTITLV